MTYNPFSKEIEAQQKRREREIMKDEKREYDVLKEHKSIMDNLRENKVLIAPCGATEPVWGSKENPFTESSLNRHTTHCEECKSIRPNQKPKNKPPFSCQYCGTPKGLTTGRPFLSTSQLTGHEGACIRNPNRRRSTKTPEPEPEPSKELEYTPPPREPIPQISKDPCNGCLLKKILPFISEKAFKKAHRKYIETKENKEINELWSAIK